MIAVRSARALAALAVLVILIARPAGAAWAPPIGIPAPAFGINEVARPTPSPWTAGTPGFYYIEPTKAGATDTSNPYGYPAKPRRTIPWTLPAGAVVEMHGIYDTSHGSPATIVPQGTAANPVFIRGVSATSRPLIRRFWEVRGTYAILENLEFGPTPDMSETGGLVIRLPASHVVLRHSDLHGTLTEGGLGIVNWEIGYGEVYTGSGVVDNVVIYDNTIHDNGNVNADFDQDVHGIGVTDHVNHLWVVDNQLYRNSGDGIQINAAIAQHAASTHHIYVGRNVSHHNKQGGYWAKQSTDVIFSQNVSYGHRPSDSSMGQCMGGQYAPDWVWFLYNRLYDCEFGIVLMSDNGEPTKTFVIGNVIYNIHRTVSDNGPGDAWGPAAIMMSGGYERHVINNTIYNVDAGVNMATPVGSLEVADNIIGNVTIPGNSHLLIMHPVLASNTSFHHNLLFGTPRLDYGNGQMFPSTTQLAQAQSINSDPQFMNPQAADFHTAATSPVANRAEFNSAHATFLQRYGVSIAFDADGNVRPASPTTDMGAYLSAGSLNQPPTISAIGSLVTNEDTPTGALSFSVGDVETPAASLTMSGASSNTAVVPNANIVFGGSGSARTVTLTPAPNMFGTTLITLTVNDGVRINTTTFALTVNPVNDAPTISAIANQITTINTPKGPIAFTIGDIETAGSSLAVSAISSNALLVPNANVVFGGSGTNRTVTVVPAAGRTGSTTITVTVSDGGLAASTAFTLAVPTTGDFDGDGKADVVLRNKVTGEYMGWRMNGLAVLDAALVATVADTNWELKGVGDLNGDGKADIVMRNKVTGGYTGWLMNGLAISNSGFLATVADTNWELAGVGDLNGDGKADIVMRNKVTGGYTGWLMNGLTIMNSAFLATVPDTNWELKGVGDLNGDGKADIVMRNKVTGGFTGWLMNGLTIMNSAFLATVADTNWEMAGVGDLNGDGTADIVMRNKVTGGYTGWLMNGLTIANSAFLATVPDTNWELKGVGDLNGDGKADIVMWNKVTGAYTGWLMNGLSIVNSAFLPTVADTNWEMVGR